MQKIEPNDGYYVTKPLTTDEFDTLYEFIKSIKMQWYKEDEHPMRNAYLPGNIRGLITIDTRTMTANQMCSIICCAAFCSGTRPIYSVDEVIALIRNLIDL